MIVEQHTDSIMAQLKSSTQTLHDETEHGTFNDELVKGRLPLANYVDWLGQMFLVHRCLEAHLRTHRTQLTMIADVVREYQLQEPYLREDLVYFGRNPEEIKPLAATAAFLRKIDETAASEPAGL